MVLLFSVKCHCPPKKNSGFSSWLQISDHLISLQRWPGAILTVLNPTPTNREWGFASQRFPPITARYFGVSSNSSIKQNSIPPPRADDPSYGTLQVTSPSLPNKTNEAIELVSMEPVLLILVRSTVPRTARSFSSLSYNTT